MKRKARSAVSLCGRRRRNDWRRKGFPTCGRRASGSWGVVRGERAPGGRALEGLRHAGAAAMRARDVRDVRGTVLSHSIDAGGALPPRRMRLARWLRRLARRAGWLR